MASWTLGCIVQPGQLISSPLSGLKIEVAVCNAKTPMIAPCAPRRTLLKRFCLSLTVFLHMHVRSCRLVEHQHADDNEPRSK